MTDRPIDDAELRELLSLLDEPVEQVPADFEESLATSLRQTLDAERSRPQPDEPSPGPTGAEEAELLTLQPLPGEPSRRRPVLAAAAVLLMLVGLGVFVSQRSNSSPTEVASEASVAAACSQFEREMPFSFDELEQLIVDQAVSESDKISALDELIGSLLALEDDLGTSPRISDADRLALGNVIGGLRQARAEVELGELERAGQSVESSRSAAVALPPGSPLAGCLAPIG